MSNENTKEIEFKIPIEELFPKFKEHLEIKNNSRILFSGKFGIGKTYFLKEFFKNHQEYEAFHFSPVNYQISSNENIVDFLKYDILIELLKKDGNLFQDNKINGIKDQITLFLSFCKQSISLNKSLRSIISSGESILELSNNPIFILLSKLGRPINDLLKLDQVFQKFKKEYKEGEKGIIDNYKEEIKTKNITETDYLSELLKEKIQIQKENKQSVLILDDLERIDPEHIFRILNVFSAHFDSQNEELPNKFGFDKIILVADVQNLRSIFHHKYGTETDFNGYLNKFFSVEIYQFKNEEIITKAIDQIISRFQIKGKDDLLKEALSERSGFLWLILRDILLQSSNLDGKERLSLRQLFKGIKFPFKNFMFKKDSLTDKDLGTLQCINISIKFFILMFGGLEIDFVSVLRRIREDIKNKEDTAKNHYHDVFSYCLLKTFSLFEEKEEHDPSCAWHEYQITIRNRGIYGVTYIAGKIDTGVNPKTRHLLLFFDLLIEYSTRKMYEKEVELF